MTRLLWVGFRAICQRDIGCFAKLGVSTEVSTAFPEAMEQIITSPPDVVVLALTGNRSELPKQIRAIRQVAPNTFIGVYVAEAHEVQRALEAGADDAVSLETTGELPCFPTMKWLEVGGRSMEQPEVQKLARRAGYLERKVEALERRVKELTRQTATDEATGLASRDSFLQHLTHAIALSRRHQTTGVLCIAEFAGLEKITDVLGDFVVGGVLAQLGAALGALARNADIVARIGPTRFAILMPATVESTADMIAERVRAALGKVALPKKQRVEAKLTVVIIRPDQKANARDMLTGIERQARMPREEDVVTIRRNTPGRGVPTERRGQRDTDCTPSPRTEDLFNPFA